MRYLKFITFALLSVCAFFCDAGNWSVAESNLVGKGLIGRWYAETRKADLMVVESFPIADWADDGRLFENPDVGIGWTPAERQAAFDVYLHTIATNDCTNLDAVEKALYYYVTFEWCDVSNYTNACGPMRTMLLNPKGIHDNLAVAQIAVKFGGVDDEATRFVETIVTNRAAYGKVIGEINRLYCQRILEAWPNTADEIAAKNRAVEMLYRTRGDARMTWMRDEVFSTNLVGYAVSSNRLAFLESAIDSTNCYPRARERFIGITNELHQTGGPLLFRTRKFYDWEE